MQNPKRIKLECSKYSNSDYKVDTFHLTNYTADASLMIEVFRNETLECVIPCDKNFITSKFQVIAAKFSSQFKQEYKNGVSIYKLKSDHDSKIVCTFFEAVHFNNLVFNESKLTREFYQLADYLGYTEMDQFEIKVENGKIWRQSLADKLTNLFIDAIINCDLNFIEFACLKNKFLVNNKFSKLPMENSAHNCEKDLYCSPDFCIQNQTAFTLACEKANVEVVKLLEKLGTDVNQTDYFGRNGLMIAAKRGDKDIIKFLHSKNKQLIHAKDKSGASAVLLACKFYGDLDTVKLLETLGADVNQTDSTGYSGLMYAMPWGNKKDIIRYLSEKQESVSISL